MYVYEHRKGVVLTHSETTRMEIFGTVADVDAARALFDACLSCQVVIEGPDNRFPLCDTGDLEVFLDELRMCNAASKPLIVISFGRDPDLLEIRSVCETAGLSYYLTPFLNRTRGCVAWAFRPGFAEALEIDTDERNRPRISLDRLAELQDDPVRLSAFVKSFLENSLVGTERVLVVSEETEAQFSSITPEGAAAA